MQRSLVQEILVDTNTVHYIDAAPGANHMCVQAAAKYYFYVDNHHKNSGTLHAAVAKHLGGKVSGDDVIFEDPPTHDRIIRGIKRVIQRIRNHRSNEIFLLAQGVLLSLGKDASSQPTVLFGKLHKIEFWPHQRMYLCAEVSKPMLDAVIEHSKSVTISRNDAGEYFILVTSTDTTEADIASILCAKSKN